MKYKTNKIYFLCIKLVAYFYRLLCMSFVYAKSFQGSRRKKTTERNHIKSLFSFIDIHAENQ